MLAYTGLRWGEAAALQVGRINLLRRRLEVVRSAVDLGGEITYGTPKTHQRREVPIPRSMIDELAVHVSGKDPDDLVFVSPQGLATPQSQLPASGVRSGGRVDRGPGSDAA